MILRILEIWNGMLVDLCVQSSVSKQLIGKRAEAQQKAIKKSVKSGY